jgi:PAS domain S-box-containing protein
MQTAPTIADYRTMIESAPEAIIVYTPEKFLYVNAFAADRLGFDQASLIGKPIMQFVHPESVPAVVDRIQGPYAANLAGVPLDVRFVARDGTVIISEIVSVPIVFQGQRALLGMIRDTSRRAEAEQELRESEQRFAKAQRAAGIAETAIAVAHEMNNVLTVLVMNAELLAHDAAPEEIPGIASEILSASGRIAATVQRLRNVADLKSVDYLGEKRMLDLSTRTTRKVSKRGK